MAFFCRGLVRRTFLGLRLFPMATPIGGGAMILGWTLLVLAALMPRRLYACQSYDMVTAFPVVSTLPPRVLK